MFSDAKIFIHFIILINTLNYILTHLDQSARAVEYADCISAEWGKYFTSISVPDLTLNHVMISWYDTSPGTLGNVKYSFNAITPWSLQTRSGSTYYSPSISQIELFNDLLYLKEFNCVQANE